MIIDKCPHCNASHVQTTNRFEEHFQVPPGYSIWNVRRCQNSVCRKLILIIKDELLGTILRVYPPVSYDLDPKIVIDAEIRNDFEEAGLCLGAGCNKASMVMSRRTLQRILKDQGCTQKKLVAAIDAAIKDNTLRDKLHPLANEIREYGNLGAHPDDDQLENVTPENAEQVLGFVRVLINEFYELPAEAEALRQSREGVDEGDES